MTAPRLRALVLEDEWVARNYLAELIEASGIGTVVAAVATVEQAEQALPPSPQRIEMGVALLERQMSLSPGPHADGGRGSGSPKSAWRPGRGRIATAPEEPHLIEIDVAFLDVQLTGPAGRRAGLTLARTLAATPGAPAVVLATAFGEHAIEAYDLGVVDYLQKPFTAERVTRCLRRVLGARPPSSSEPRLARVVARKGKSLVFLRLEEVWAFEASGRLVNVHGARGTMDMDLSLAALEAQLTGQVLRVHRNWLVNVDRVLEMVRDGADNSLVVGAGGAGAPLVVPVTRERAAEVRAALLDRMTPLDPRG